jgi:hypothetical protein
MVAKSTVDLFKMDLWKDQRKLDVVENKTQIEKYYESDDELNTELSVINFLVSHNAANVPSVEHIPGKLFVRMPYYKGIRIFNLLVELDSIGSSCGELARKIKGQLIGNCEQHQKQIHQALLLWKKTQPARVAYPHVKITTIVLILADCLGIEVDTNVIGDEVSRINTYWRSVATVPFRDATTKNMLLHSELLHLSNFDGEESRRDYISKSIIDKRYNEWLDAPIVNFDFSSCVHDTTPEDDVISLKYHERTWEGRTPSANNLIWHGESDPKRAAISFLIRYLRFGGRKAAYRLIHPSGHRIRFRYDDDSFYFERLPSIIKSLWPEFQTEYPSLVRFIEMTARYLKFNRNEVDAFLEAGHGSNRSTYYSDIFDLDV